MAPSVGLSGNPTSKPMYPPYQGVARVACPPAEAAPPTPDSGSLPHRERLVRVGAARIIFGIVVSVTVVGINIVVVLGTFKHTAVGVPTRETEVVAGLIREFPTKTKQQISAKPASDGSTVVLPETPLP